MITREPEIREFSVNVGDVKIGFFTYRPNADAWIINVTRPMSTQTLKELITSLQDEITFNESVQSLK